MNKVTIQDVADAVGVSKATISRFLNGQRGRMSKETHDKIQNTIETMGYIPSQQARALKSKHSNLIGLVVADIGNLYTSFLIKGIQMVLGPQDYQLLISDAANDPKIEQDALERFISQNVDGIILQPQSNQSSSYGFVDQKRIPMVLVDRKTTPLQWSMVASDDYAASVRLANKLVESGYQRFVVVSNPVAGKSTRELRLKAFQSVADKNKVELKLIEVDIEDSAVEGLIDYLKSSQQKTVIFATNGRVLNNCVAYLKENKIEIPTQVGIVGYDDSNMGMLIDPPLSTIDQHPKMIGQQVGKLILEQLKDKKEPNIQEVKSDIVVRKSF
ncbi:LacI family DNA-binding transcriptional regulator [Pediococcus argentinicus]|uniref:Uncharacterized protein n=1 Tax=Pediococcus argentinicus TaxID=480391 RepID=A0A0R2NH22_9LACO|nr:LacI family DNA-binding transcriptional regulator [Pediococcus argentinicus]KRO25092.1 hypothetical protein IV88_GL000425 [Pediococcus argentinicus]NKZ22564.1 LacI family transcriptional regulator [Pediococcus argentinicus]GEP19598.1 LacI family transcriptional regulator [Pediococcus argentinicus]